MLRQPSLLARRVLTRPLVRPASRQQLPTIISAEHGVRAIDPVVSVVPQTHFFGSATAQTVSRNESKSNDPEEELLRQPFPSYFDQIKMFPVGVKKLWNDIKTYRYIQDASSTKNIVWPNGGAQVPRRQRAFQRKLLKELLNVAVPVVGYVVIPVAGNAFVVLAIAFPKVFLSWHFLTPSQSRSFASDEYWFRITYYRDLIDCLWSTISAERGNVNAETIRGRLDVVDDDAAGPVYKDISPLLDMFASDSGLSDLHSLPDYHVLTVARSSDLLRPPFAVSSFLLNFIPSSLTAAQVDKIAESIVEDDELLILEGHECNGCASLTAEEVIDACLVRGLPSEMALSMGEMRQCLTNHLRMTRQIPPEADKAQVRSFLMHLPAIRESMKREA
mmetsp:Transcript_6265/g.11983  ORF Transcript_6265/g.11983 Transcript_6265/m.11983 type:complete len:389 (+) Transcript_6265:202-1368(+)